MSSLLGRTIISYLIVFAVPMILPVAFFKLVGLGGLRELVTYEARDTPLHNLDPRLKVLYPIAMGILSIIAGLILLAYPGISLLVLYVIVGIWLLVFGFMEISIAWQMRAASHRPSGREAHAT